MADLDQKHTFSVSNHIHDTDMVDTETRAVESNLSLREENNLMVDRLAAICNKVIPAFKQDFYMTPLRLNRDLKYGPAT